MRLERRRKNNAAPIRIPRTAAPPQAPPMMAPVGTLGFGDGEGELDESPDAEGDEDADVVGVTGVVGQDGPDPTATRL